MVFQQQDAPAVVRLLIREHDVRLGEFRDEMRILTVMDLLDAIAGETIHRGHC